MYAREIGEAAAEVEAEPEGKPMSIARNSRLLLDALLAFDVERIEMRLGSPVSPAVIRGIGAESCTCVVMPVRLAAPPNVSAGRKAV